MATYLTSNTGTATNAKKFTYSVWLKRSAIDSSASQRFYQGYKDSNNRFYAYFVEGADSNEDRLWIYAVTGGTVEVYWVSNRRFRDTNAWYHIVFSADSTQASQGDRFKVYVNGVEETSWTKTNNPSQNIDWGNQLAQTNGDLTISGTESQSQPFLGLMSHINFIDGTAYPATAFGSFDNDTGEWKINTSPSVTYGNNGYFILKDGNTITDSSPNSNDFTLASGTLTKTEDCPSNVFATLNPLTIGGTAATLGNGNNSIVGGSASAEWYSASTIAPSTGKWYVEIRNDFASGQSADMIVGFTTNLIDVTNEAFPGKSSHSLGLWSSGTDVGDIKINNSVVSNQYTGSWDSTNTILGMALDLDNKIVYFSINGVWQSSGNPSSGSGGYDFSSSLTPFEDNYFIAIGSYYNSLTINKCSVNFGNGYFGTTAVSSAGTNASGIGIFEYDVPTGYTALSTKGLNL